MKKSITNHVFMPINTELSQIKKGRLKRYFLNYTSAELLLGFL
jgi:hypothetical protein